jgi:uncharacterized protein (TIGR02678 family)
MVADRSASDGRLAGRSAADHVSIGRLDDEGDPQAAGERRGAARHLLQHPLTCREHDPDLFRLIRRHDRELDRWFTQRLGYRLHVDADTARLTKTSGGGADRPLTTRTGRALTVQEQVVLALVLASVAAGPAVVSLRDLVGQVRTAAAEAELVLSDSAADRRVLVTVLRWMIDQGLAGELHAHIDDYAADENADAVLRVRPDRIALLPLPALLGAATTEELLERADHRRSSRQWMRARLVEEPVLYRGGVTDAEWAELRRRLGDEERIIDEMFGLVLEARAEGVAAVDPSGALTDQRFPRGGTLGHAALLLIDALRPAEGTIAEPVSIAVARATLVALTEAHATHWSQARIDNPDLFLRDVIDLLVAVRLAEVIQPDGHAGEVPTISGDDDDDDDGDGDGDAANGDRDRDARSPMIRLLPGAGRFLAVTTTSTADQEALW